MSLNFYDITSSYFEGIKCVLAKFGYSRDHRPDKEQIVIALMITKEGYPFYWKVLEGNTQDITTVESLVDNIKNRFGIKSCILVFDRGMVSADNLALIERNPIKLEAHTFNKGSEGKGICNGMYIIIFLTQ